MTKTAFIGDVHGYAPAFKRAIQWCESKRVDEIVGLGDIVDGYDADEECVQLAKDYFQKSVRGNHDEDHGKLMASEAKQWLVNLPNSLEHEGWLVTHSSPRSTRTGEYIRNSFEAWNCFDDCEFERCVVGHTHQPMLYRYRPEGGCDSESLDATGDGQVLDRASRYLLVNPSLAYNRSGQQNPGFSIFDSEQQRVQIIYLDMPQFKVKF